MQPKLSATVMKERVMTALAGVSDPEIPTISIVDLGMVEDVRVHEAPTRVEVDLVPTFLGCPALAMISQRAMTAIRTQLGLSSDQVRVLFSTRSAWDTTRIHPQGRDRLKAFGMAPPPKVSASEFVAGQTSVACPFCGSEDTKLENIFGPTACRAMFYCRRCRNPFEAIKPV